MKTAMTRAELVRRLQPGVQLKLVWRSTDGVKNQGRTVIQATTYSVLMSGSEYRSGTSRLHLRNARVYALDNGFEVHWPAITGQCDSMILRYEWLNTLTPVPPAQQLELKGASS